MNISKEQWNRLNQKQKTVFQEEVGEIYKISEYPSINHVSIFLSNNNLLTSIILERMGKIPVLRVGHSDLEDIEIKWKKVCNFFGIK